MKLRFPVLACVVALVCLPWPGNAQEPAALSAPQVARDAHGVITVTGAAEGATIRYTIDGNDPGPKSGPYLAPIELPAGGVVKARVFSADRKQKSELAELRADPMVGVAPQPSTLVPCTQDRDWPIYDWAVRHAAVSKLAQSSGAQTVFLGDSITQMFGGEPHDRPQPGREVWERHFGMKPVLNLGFGYDYVENALWRVQHGELDGVRAKAVVILIGTNNAGKNTAEEITAGVKALCAEVHQRQPAATIYLMAIFPRGAKPDAMREKVAATNRLLSNLEGVKFVDIGEKFLEPDGTITREMMSDFLHPTAKGYEIWATEIEKALGR